MILIGYYVHRRLSRYIWRGGRLLFSCVRLFFTWCFLLLPCESEKPDTQATSKPGPVVRRLNNAIRRINCYPVDNNLRSWRDFACDCVCFGSEAVNASVEGEKVEFAAREFPRGTAREYNGSAARLLTNPASEILLSNNPGLMYVVN